MADYATLEDLQSRLEWDLDELETRVALSALTDLSIDATSIGKDWGASPPAYVTRVVLAATVRYMKNLEGVVTSRAGDETLTFNEVKEGAGSPRFTGDEIVGISKAATGLIGFGTIPILNMGGDGVVISGLVPTDIEGERMIPLFAEGDDS